jgi:hypothetical protein
MQPHLVSQCRTTKAHPNNRSLISLLRPFPNSPFHSPYHLLPTTHPETVHEILPKPTSCTLSHIHKGKAQYCATNNEHRVFRYLLHLIFTYLAFFFLSLSLSLSLVYSEENISSPHGFADRVAHNTQTHTYIMMHTSAYGISDAGIQQATTNVGDKSVVVCYCLIAAMPQTDKHTWSVVCSLSLSLSLSPLERCPKAQPLSRSLSLSLSHSRAHRETRCSPYRSPF